MEKVPGILLITSSILAIILAEDSRFRFGVISHNSAEIFVTLPCGEGIVEYRNVETGKAAQLQITKPPYATKITGLQPATKYQIRILPSQYKHSLWYKEGLTKSQQIDWNGDNTFQTGLFTVFGRVTLKKSSHEGNYVRANSLEWNSSLALIEESYAKLALPYKDIKIIRILNDRLEMPVVHYCFKLEELSNLTSYKLTGLDFGDSVIHSGGAPDGTPYVVKEGNKVILFYRSNTECFSLIERYMGVSRDNGTTTEVHLNVADATATQPTEEDGLEVTSEGDLLRDDGRPVGRLEPDTLVMLNPRFLVLDCQINSTVPIYSEVYGGIDYVTKQPADIIYKYIEPENISLGPVELKIKRGRNQTVIYIPPVQYAVKYEILSADKVVSTVEGEDVKCRQYTKATIHGFEDSKSYTISLRAVVQNKLGKHVSVILKRNVFVRAEECAMPRLASNLRLTNSRRKRILYFKCSHGTQLRGRNYAVCDRNGRWTTFPSCEEIPMPCRVKLVRNSLTPKRNRLIIAKGETVRYTCRDGYTLRGNDNLTCIGLHWDKQKPSCIRMTCRVSKLNPHLTRQGRRHVYQVGAGIVFSCDEGFRMEGNSTSKCLINGSWSSKPPHCMRKKIHCEIPFRLQQFSVINPMREFYNESEVIRYSCDPGYTPYRSTTSMCLPSGHWSTKLPHCKKFAVKCTASSLQRRWIRPEQYFSVGYRIVFGCPHGYRIYGSYTTHCLPNGRWSSPKPVCYPSQL